MWEVHGTTKEHLKSVQAKIKYYKELPPTAFALEMVKQLRDRERLLKGL